MMRADSLNSHSCHVRTKMTAPSSHVYYTDKDESKGIIVHETLSQSCFTDEEKSKVIIVNVILLQICSTDVDKLCSMEEDE